jgi:hypothetical protein
MQGLWSRFLQLTSTCLFFAAVHLPCSQLQVRDLDPSQASAHWLHQAQPQTLPLEMLPLLMQEPQVCCRCYVPPLGQGTIVPL